MRYLHPVAASEKFIARGLYRFYENDVLLPKTEAWTRHRLAGGGILTRVDREHEFDGLTTLIEVLTDDDGRFQRLSVREWNTSPQADHKTCRVEYIFFEDYIQITRRVDEGAAQNTEVRFPQTTILDLTISAFRNVRFERMAKAAPDETVFTCLRPCWWTETLIETLELTRPDDIFGTINNLTPRYTKPPTIVYNASMDRYLGVDEHAIPLQYEDHQKKSLIVLTEYAHI